MRRQNYQNTATKSIVSDKSYNIKALEKAVITLLKLSNQAPLVIRSSKTDLKTIIVKNALFELMVKWL